MGNSNSATSKPKLQGSGPPSPHSKFDSKELSSSQKRKNQKGSRKELPSTRNTSNQQSSRKEISKSSPQLTKLVSNSPSTPNSQQQRREHVEEEDHSNLQGSDDVTFFEEESCRDPNDEFSFPCCTPPYSPRYPPNPRPKRIWSPSVLPTTTYLANSIGTRCKRCGRPVFSAEIQLSSRGIYHSECFICCLCGKSLDSWSVSEYKGEIFCKGCYRRNFSIHGCGFGIGAGALQTP